MAPNSPILSQLIVPERILELKPSTKEDALRILSAACAATPQVADGEAFFKAILKREAQVSTGVGMGIAIPHVKIPEVSDYVAAVGRCREGLNFDSLDGAPVNLIFLIGASDRQTREFVKILAQVTHLLKSRATREALLAAPIPHSFIEIIKSAES
ncbi:PTS sugar transporter subunit IIA [bacterium]|nr:PTS sugar transporter subunit IIA [bacterium]